MVYLYIDNYAVAPLSGDVAIDFDAEQLVDLDKADQIGDISMEVTIDPSMMWLFGGEGYLHAAERFNSSVHRGAICCEGVEVVSGQAILVAVRREGEQIVHTIRIEREMGEWIGSGAANMFNTLPIEYEKRLLLSTIYESWEQSAELSPVKFFPVYRDNYVDYFYDSLSEVVVRTRSIDDYHPFINIYQVVSTILAQDGYQLVSEFMESDYFKSLYMSGAYSSQDSEAVRSAMNFFVKQTSSTSAVGSTGGRVYITDLIGVNSVGNFIDISSVDDDDDCFNYNNCLSVSNGTITFTPTVEVSMGLEFRIKYRTDYVIDSRSLLEGYNRFYFYSSNFVEIDIPNSFEDNRGATIYGNHTYRIVVFDHVDGSSYMISALERESGERVTLLSFADRSVLYSTGSQWSDDELYDLELYELVDGDYALSDLDWALYDGYVSLEGSVVVDLTVRTIPETFSPDSPLKITAMFAESGEGSATFELLEGSSLSPVFAEYPGYGSLISFADVAQHSIRQRVVFESLIHLFNLRLYTDELSRRVYIEPYDTFVDSAECFDWSSKIDLSESITYEDVAADVARSRTWGYQREDGYTVRSNEGEEMMFGDWSVECSNYLSTDSEQSLLDPIFSPSLNNDDGELVVGDRDDILTIDTLEFAPRIVCFGGVETKGNSSVPAIYFHSVDHDFTLCFDDCDGLSGLNRYYTRQVECEQRSQYVIMTLSLTPYEVASLSSPLERRASLLSNFRFLIDGEWILCRLHSLQSYDLDSSQAQCKFLIIN